MAFGTALGTHDPKQPVPTIVVRMYDSKYTEIWKISQFNHYLTLPV
ncbi:hypothetical protein [Paenibacillus sp. FSL R10-2734]